MGPKTSSGTLIHQDNCQNPNAPQLLLSQKDILSNIPRTQKQYESVTGRCENFIINYTGAQKVSYYYNATCIHPMLLGQAWPSLHTHTLTQ